MDENRFVALFGDLHNHCNISYAHGDLEDALLNAALRLDFVSITGHADWPDMDEDDPRIAHIVDFHQKGFAKLSRGWQSYLERIAAFEKQTGLVTYPGYEIHSGEHGDYTIVGREHDLPMTLAESPQELRERFRERHGSAATASPPVLLFPHHIGYRRGARGVNWDSFSEDFSPIVEIYSMHGLADDDRSDKPSLHSMGPWQHCGTMENGLNLGKWFGVIGNTDHHSGHPGSYGHGLTGVWAESRDRAGIWEAIYARRTWAMTGDLTRLWFTVAGVPMGGTAHAGAASTGGLPVEISVDATAAIDYVELVVNGKREQLWWESLASATGADEAIVELELGWGERGKVATWDVEAQIAGGEILEMIPRFRGPEVVSPLDDSGGSIPTHHSEIASSDSRGVRFSTTTWGNMTNSTPSTQGLALRVSSPEICSLELVMNGRKESYTIRELLAGSVSGNLGPIDSPAFRVKAIDPRSYRWQISWDGAEPPARPEQAETPRWMMGRARLKNGHWVISSPVRIV